MVALKRNKGAQTLKGRMLIAHNSESLSLQCSAAARTERQMQENRPSNGRRKSSGQSSLIESARKQLEASFGTTSQTPWDSAESSAQAMDIIAKL